VTVAFRKTHPAVGVPHRGESISFAGVAPQDPVLNRLADGEFLDRGIGVHCASRERGGQGRAAVQRIRWADAAMMSPASIDVSFQMMRSDLDWVSTTFASTFARIFVVAESVSTK